MYSRSWLQDSLATQGMSQTLIRMILCSDFSHRSLRRLAGLAGCGSVPLAESHRNDGCCTLLVLVPVCPILSVFVGSVHVI